MWVLTTQGFYSVVAHRDDPGQVLVRARTRQDLAALAAQIDDLDITHTPGADYPWRAVVRREAWEHAAAELAAAIDYPNFKAAVADRQGSGRESVYSQVWATLRRLSGRSGA